MIKLFKGIDIVYMDESWPPTINLDAVFRKLTAGSLEVVEHSNNLLVLRDKDTAALPPQPQPKPAEGTDASDPL